LTGMIASGKLRSTAIASGLYALGVAESSAALNLAAMQTKLWKGQSVDTSAILVQFTYRGDANLDGRINVDDYGRIDFNVALGSTGWFNGDFNLDGKINVDDYGIIDFNVAIQGPPLSGGPEIAASSLPAPLTAVPEPTSFGVLLPATALLIHRRQRRSV